MRKMMLMMVAAMLSLAPIAISAQPHRAEKARKIKKVNTVGPSHRIAGTKTIAYLPTKSVALRYAGRTFYYDREGRYYVKVGLSGYDRVRPPMGMLVKKLYDEKKVTVRGEKLYLSRGVLYSKVKTTDGKRYKVVGYR